MRRGVIFTDKIILKGLRIYAYHGVNAEEKEKGQPFVVDVTAYADLSLPCATDRVGDTVNYAKLSKTVRAVMLEAKYDLIEKAAGRIAEQIFADFAAVESLEVTVKKPRAPMTGDFDYAAVSIARSRS